MPGHADQQVLEHRELRELGGKLEGAHEAPLRPLVRGKAGDVCAVQQDPPGRGGQCAREHGEQG